MEGDPTWTTTNRPASVGQRPPGVRMTERGSFVELFLERGFTAADLDFVKGFPGRRWHPRERMWTVPHAPETVLRIERWFGARLIVTPGANTESTGSPAIQVGAAQVAPDEVSAAEPELLTLARHQLAIRGFSHRTRKVYLAHLRRFLDWCGPAADNEPSAWVTRYLFDLVDNRRVTTIRP